MRGACGWLWRLMRRIVSGVDSMADGAMIFVRWNVAVAEVLGRLCAGTMRYEKSPRGCMAVLSGVEVAGYLSGLDRGPMLLALAKFMGDEDALKWLLVEHQAWLRGVARREGWMDVNVVHRLAALSLSEVVDDKCQRCHGTKFVRAKVCTACDGTGIRRVSDRYIAAALGIANTSYQRNWRPRYADSVARLRGFEVDVNRALSRSIWQGVLESV